jgi:hypothetical protein
MFISNKYNMFVSLFVLADNSSPVEVNKGQAKRRYLKRGLKTGATAPVLFQLSRLWGLETEFTKKNVWSISKRPQIKTSKVHTKRIKCIFLKSLFSIKK